MKPKPIQATETQNIDATTTVRYTTTGPVTSQLEYSTKVGTVYSDYLPTYKFDDVKTMYNSYFKSYATTDFSATAVGRKVKDYFTGSRLTDDAYAMMALDGTAPYTDNNARAEAVQKVLWDAVAVRHLLAHAEQGNWDAAAAFWVGTDSKYSPYARAEKRAANYGTQATGSDGSKVAQANVDALAALKMKNYNKLLDAVLVVYAQCTLRYMYILDNDKAKGTSPLEHQGEGAAFARVLAPYVADADQAGYDAIMKQYTPGEPLGDNMYCTTKSTLDKVLSSSVKSAMGTLEGAPECGDDAKKSGAAVMWRIMGVTAPAMLTAQLMH